MHEPLQMSGMSAERIPREVVALLKGLQLTEPDLEPLKKLSSDEWHSLLDFCDLSHLTLPLAQLPMEGMPWWVVDRLRSNLADNAKRFERLKETYREIAEALDRFGVEYIVIKGFTQAPDYVPSPGFRLQSDFDLFCQPTQIGVAQAALESIGYIPVRSKQDRRADHVPPLVRPGKWMWKGNPFDADMPPGIDLHFCLWNESAALFSVPIGDFWDRRVLRSVEGLDFPALHPVDHLGYLSLHILRNILRGDWIVHLVRELASFLHAHAHDNAFWANWSEMHDDSLRSFEAIAFYYARAWFGCAVHSHVENAIADLHPTQFHWLRRVCGTGLENMFRRNKDSVWLHMTFLTSTRKKWTILTRTFIPTRISSISSPAVVARNKSGVPSKSKYRLRPYIGYLMSRSSSHVRANLTALCRALYWRLSRHRLSPQFWIFLAASFFFDLGLSTYYFLFNLFLVGHGYTEKDLGFFTSAMAVGNLLGALPSGKLAQRLGLRPVLLACFVLAIALSTVRALLLSFPLQLLLAFLAGVTLSAWAVCLPIAVAQLTEEKERPVAFSLLFSLGIGLGALAGLAGSRLPGLLGSYRLHDRGLDPAQLVLLLSCGIVALGLWPAMKLRFTRTEVSGRPRPILSPFLLRYLPAVAVWSLVTGSFSPLASVYLARHVHLSLQQIGNAFSLSQIAQVGAVLLAPVFLQRWGLIRSIVFTQIAAASMLLAMGFLDRPLVAVVAYICFSAFQWMNEPALFSLLMKMVPPEDRSGAAASNSLVMSGSQAVAGTLAGGAFARYGYPAVLRGIALMALLAASFFRNLQERRLPKSSPVLDDVSG
jgi:predicted MFS family arabinose efflux permease